MDIPVLAGLTGASAAAAALLAHEARAVYHDGLRMRVRDTTAGREARLALVREGWQMSSGFIAWFALPVSLLTGILVSHLVFLPADLVGIGVGTRAKAIVASALLGGAIAAAIALAGWAVSQMPFGISQVPHAFAQTAAVLVPVIPISASVRVGPIRYGIASGVLGAGIWLLASTAGFDTVAWPTIAACIPLVVVASRSRPADVNLDGFAPEFERVRQSAPGLVLFAVLIGALGGASFLAGEPLAAWLLFGGQYGGAATVAVLTAVAFMPLVVTSAMSSGVYSTQGYPDWLLAPGYVSQNPLVSAPIAGALMLGETHGLRRLSRVVIRYPELSSVSAGLRAGSEDVLVLTGTIGGAIAAIGSWGELGLYGFGALCLVNEASSRRVPRIAIGPASLIVLVLVRAAWGLVVG